MTVIRLYVNQGDATRLHFRDNRCSTTVMSPSMTQHDFVPCDMMRYACIFEWHDKLRRIWYDVMQHACDTGILAQHATASLHLQKPHEWVFPDHQKWIQPASVVLYTSIGTDLSVHFLEEAMISIEFKSIIRMIRIKGLDQWSQSSAPNQWSRSMISIKWSQ